jgi:BASS family bile acid:Na+ symporter
MTELLIVLIKLSIVAIIIAVGAGTAPADISYLWQRPRLLIRSLIAMYVLVPLVAFVLVLVLPVTPGVKAALLVLAVSAGAPLLPKKLRLLRSPEYIFSLLATSSLVAIVVVPLWVALLAAYFNVTVDLPLAKVVMAIVKAILLPLAIGMVIRLMAPAVSARLSDAVIKLASPVLAVAAIVLLALHWGVVMATNWPGVVALAILLISALFIGHRMGGPHPDDRIALAVACATRHIGIALIVATEFRSPGTAVIVVSYIVTAVVISSLYLTWWGRKAAAATTPATPPS